MVFQHQASMSRSRAFLIGPAALSAIACDNVTKGMPIPPAPVDTTLPTEEPSVPSHAAGGAPGRTPVVGDLIADRFELVRVLGSGGMAIVFEARDLVEDETVALKWLRQRGHTETLRREFRAVAGLRHPNLVGYINLFIDKETTFLTMERSDGEPLDRLLEKLASDASASDRLVDIFRQLAATLAFVHRAGVVHCDLKPSNVLVEPTGRVRIIDFGLARHRETPPHAWLGTRNYAAPEVITRRQHSQAADWYAFGKMLSLAVTRGRAFTESPLGAKLAELAAALLDPDPATRPSYEAIATAFGDSQCEEPLDAAPFIGRADELDILRRAFESCLARNVEWVDVQGPSGIGKTRLVLEACGDLAGHASPPWVCWSTAYERESVPFRTLAPLLSALAHRQLREPIALGTAEEPTLRMFARCLRGEGEDLESTRIAHTLGTLLAQIAEQQPIVIVLDQLQAGDADSANLLVDALAQCARARVLVVAIARSDAGVESDFLRIVASRRQPWRRTPLDVAPLKREEVFELLGSSEPHTKAHIAEQSAGLPWLALELAREGAGFAAPFELVQARLANLPARIRRLAELVAIADHPLSIEVARAALGSSSFLAADVRALVSERILQVAQAGALVTNHDIVGAAIRTAVSDDDARQVHFNLAETLIAIEPWNGSAIAAHLFAAGRAHEAVPHAFAAADRAAAAFAFGSEARWLEQILASATLDAGRALECRRRLARALGRAGRGVEAAREYQRAVRDGKALEQLRDRCHATAELLRAGHRDRGLEMLERLAAEVGLPFPKTELTVMARFAWERARLRVRGVRITERADEAAHERALLQCEVATIAREQFLRTDHLRSALFATLSLRFGLDSGTPDRVCRALCDEVILLANLGAPAIRTASLLAQARELAMRTANPELTSRVELAAGAQRLMSGQFGEAAALLSSGAAASLPSALGRSWELTMCRLLWLTAMQFYGPATDCLRVLDAWISDADERNDLAAKRAFLTKHSLFALLADDVPTAIASARDARQIATDSVQLDASALHQNVYLALYDGALAQTLTTFRPRLWRLVRAGLRRSQGLRVTTLSVLGALELQIAASDGRGFEARTRARYVIHRLRREKTAYSEAFALGLVSALHHQRGESTRAREALEEARALALGCGMRFFAAAADLRGALVTNGTTSLARVQEATAALRTLGVARPARYVRTVLPGFIEPKLATSVGTQ